MNYVLARFTDTFPCQDELNSVNYLLSAYTHLSWRSNPAH